MFYPFNLSTLNSNTYLKHLNTTNSLPDNKFGQKGRWVAIWNDETAVHVSVVVILGTDYTDEHGF